MLNHHPLIIQSPTVRRLAWTAAYIVNTVVVHADHDGGVEGDLIYFQSRSWELNITAKEMSCSNLVQVSLVTTGLLDEISVLHAGSAILG